MLTVCAAGGPSGRSAGRAGAAGFGGRPTRPFGTLRTTLGRTNFGTGFDAALPRSMRRREFDDMRPGAAGAKAGRRATATGAGFGSGA